MDEAENDDTILKFKIQAQPDDVTCGPTCLQAVYNYFGDHIGIQDVINEVIQLKTGGTLAVLLGIHALKRNYKVTIFTFNLHIFDPTWFEEGVNLEAKLLEQLKYKKDIYIPFETDAYLQFLRLGGKIRFEEMTPALIKKYLLRDIPILTGLNATYLYHCKREIGVTNQYDDVRGESAGHFVVVNGYSKNTGKVYISDPLNPNPMAETQYYQVNPNRLINAIMLGIVTYDANLLIIHPQKQL